MPGTAVQKQSMSASWNVFGEMLVNQCKIQHYHRILHKSAPAFVTGIRCQPVRTQKFHGIRIMVHINKCPVGQSKGIHFLQIDRKDDILTFILHALQQKSQPPVGIKIEVQDSSSVL